MSRQTAITLTAVMLLSMTLAVPVRAEQEPKDVEVEYLLAKVGSSGCLFVRNGTEHDATEAESHLRMKYRRGKRYISDAEDFIARIASKSSWSGKPYQIKCPQEPAEDADAWLMTSLESFRSSATK